MEFKSLDLNQSIDVMFKALAKKLGVKNCMWMSQVLVSQLMRISRENWLTIENLKKFDHTLFPFKKEEDRLWFWEQGLQVKNLVTINHPSLGADFTFCPVFHPDTKARLGLMAFENNGSNLLAIQELIDCGSRHIGFCLDYAEAKKLSYVDDLTSLFNQRYLPQVLSQEIDRCQRQSQKFSVLFLDVDYFKRVNDGHGHLIGSQLLVEVSQIVKATIRSYDPLFRYGGDEFLALLVDTDKVSGEKVAERIRRAVESHDFIISGKALKLTVSIGLSVFPDHARSAQELIQLADQAMYYGKNKSRNIVYIAS